jgi:hypothetical protein
MLVADERTTSPPLKPTLVKPPLGLHLWTTLLFGDPRHALERILAAHGYQY